MRFFFSLFKPKKPQIKEDPMSEVQQHLAAIDEIYKDAYFALAHKLTSLAWRIIHCPEIIGKAAEADGRTLVQIALNDPQNFASQARTWVAQMQQKPSGN